MRKNLLFLDGLLIPVTKTFLESLSPVALKGKGVFETMRSYNGVVFAEDKHLNRLLKGLESLDIKGVCSRKKIKEHLHQALSINKLRNARLRLTIWKEKRKVRISVVAWPYGAMPKIKREKGFTAVISDIRRDETSKLTRLKSIKYLPLMQAWQEARAKGNDEALLLNLRGFLAEGSRTNIFFVKKGVLFTPSLRSGCLKGITRQIVLNIAKRLKVQQKQVLTRLEDLYEADEAFLTNSVIEIAPLTSVQGRSIAGGRPGPLTKKLSKAYKLFVKKECWTKK